MYSLLIEEEQVTLVTFYLVSYCKQSKTGARKACERG